MIEKVKDTLHGVALQIELAGNEKAGALTWEQMGYLIKEYLLLNMPKTSTLAEYEELHTHTMAVLTRGVGPLGPKVWGIHSATSAVALLREIAQIVYEVEPEEQGGGKA